MALEESTLLVLDVGNVVLAQRVFVGGFGFVELAHYIIDKIKELRVDDWSEEGLA